MKYVIVGSSKLPVPEPAREALRAVAGALLHPAATRRNPLPQRALVTSSPAQAWPPPMLGSRVRSGLAGEEAGPGFMPFCLPDAWARDLRRPLASEFLEVRDQMGREMETQTGKGIWSKA